MSYHETYEFFALDRCLTPAEMRALRAVSTRATITPVRFYNVYDWGGLKGDPRELLRRYFDLFVHTGNGRPEWGMLRFPAGGIDLRRWRPYVPVQRRADPPARVASVAAAEDVAVLTIVPAEEATFHSIGRASPWDADDDWREDWIDDELADEASWPVPLALVRAELLAGDLRPLYLLWLLSVQCGERRASTAEPLQPPGLERPTGSLWMFAEFLGLNADLLTVAVEAASGTAPRTAGQMLDAARAVANARQRAAAKRAAVARTKRLTTLAKRQASEWSELDHLLGASKVEPSIYDDVMRRLSALQELGVDRGEETMFRARLQTLLGRHGSKTALQRRVREAGLAGSGEDR